MIRSFLRVNARSTNNGWGRIQFLERVWKLGPLTLWVKEVDREEVPPHVVIEVCALGWTWWKSKWFGMPGVFWKTREGYVLHEQGNKEAHQPSQSEV